MKIIYILSVKSIRDGELIELLLMFLLIFGSIYKGTFLPYSLIPILFGNKLFNLIWNNQKEKLFYLQFEKNNLKKIMSIKQFFLIANFNLIYILSLSIFCLHFNYPCLKNDNWIILNIYIFINLILANLIFNIINKKNNTLLFFLKMPLFIIVNILTIITIYSIKMYSSFPSILLSLFLTALFFIRLYTVNLLFKNFNKHIPSD